MFEQIVNASGLAPVIASSAIRRALTKAGINPTRMTPEELGKGLDSIEACLRVYLQDHEVSEGMERIRKLMRGRPARHDRQQEEG